MPSSRPLGDYLRARRELLQPDDVGLPSGNAVRRVPGLRRSEVATLAGISTEYYVKLEQGQDANPTHQVLEALSGALRLDATANSYLHSLARLTERPVQPTPAASLERAQWLIDSWPRTAAMVLDRHHDILATNALMTALVGAYQTGRNALTALLLDPSMRELYLEWDGLSKRSIGLLRSTTGPHPDMRAREVIEELTAGSQRFRELWGRHDIAGLAEGVHPMRHPRSGELAPHFAHFPLVGSDGHSIFLYYTEPGSRTAQAFEDLAAGR